MITNLSEKHHPQPVAGATGLGQFAEASMMRRTKMFWVAALALTLLLGANHPATAQTATSGAVLGKVTDPSGAVVVGAEVTLTDTATNRVLTQQSNAEGNYTFVNVLPGLYTLRVSSQGFRTASLSGVNVEVNKSFTADIALEIGDTASTVEVTAGVGTEIQTTDAQVGNVIGERMIRNLPTLQRNATELLSLQPATTPGGFATGGTVSGARSDQNTLILDGIDVSDNLTGGQGVDFTQAPVGVDAVSEFRVTVTNPNATFGRSSGGQMT
ncbi:MAG: carboxypeptidase-like regulatory domain-containing protein, partial [Candidatus Acidiferrales bacterium]